MAKDSRLTDVPDGVPDAENPEWTGERLRRAQPAEQVLPAAFLDNVRRHRGPQKAPTKQTISLRVDRDVLEAYRATGRGWQGRMQETLARHVASMRRGRAKKATSVRRSSR